jgi:catechol 2,3-dioxygenase-like lactoylglutathione lyase family enzyme
MDAAITFYEHRLGLVRFREWGDRPRRGVVYFLGGGFLELTEGGTQPPPAPGGRSGGNVRLWLQVADASVAADELRAAGVGLLEEPERKPWGLIEFVVEDPDGLRIVVVETPLDHPLRRRQ